MPRDPSVDLAGAARIGTAFDYALRFGLEGRFKVDSHRVVAADVARHIYPYGDRWLIPDEPPPLTEAGVQARAKLVREVHDAIEEARAGCRPDRLSFEGAAACLRLVPFDDLYRSGDDRGIGRAVLEAEARQVQALFAVVPWAQFASTKELRLNPDVGVMLRRRLAADADLVVDDLLVDIKTSERVDRRWGDDWLQVVCYAVLANIAGLAPDGGDGPFRLGGIEKVGLYLARFGQLVTTPLDALLPADHERAMLSVLLTRDVPKTRVPILHEGSLLWSEARAGFGPELCRVRGIGTDKVLKLRRAGIGTLQALAKADASEVARALNRSALKEPTRLIARAQALLARKPLLLGPWPLPDEAIFLDVEGADDRSDHPWMVGCLTPEGTFHQFVERDPDEQGALLEAIGQVLEDRPATPVVTWGTNDKGALRGVCKRLGLTEPAWLTRFIDASGAVDRCLALPLADQGLKTVGRHLGLAWREEGMDGRTVGHLYRRYRDEGVPFDHAAVARYNEDDVRVLAAVVGRLRTVHEELERTEVPPPDPIELLVDLLAEHEPASGAHLASAAGMTERSTLRILRQLEKLGAVVRRGKARSTRWYLG